MSVHASPVRVLLWGGSSLLRAGLRHLIEADDTLIAVDRQVDPAHQPDAVDVVLVDLDYPAAADDLTAALRPATERSLDTILRLAALGTPTAALSWNVDSSTVRAALRHGATGYLYKGLSFAELSTAIGQVAQGQGLVRLQRSETRRALPHRWRHHYRVPTRRRPA